MTREDLEAFCALPIVEELVQAFAESADTAFRQKADRSPRGMTPEEYWRLSVQDEWSVIKDVKVGEMLSDPYVLAETLGYDDIADELRSIEEAEEAENG